MTKKFIINLDGVGYPVEVRQYKNIYMVEIGEAQGSILKRLDNRPEVTGHRYSDEYRFMDRDAMYPVEMHWDQGLVCFLISDADSHEGAFEFVVDWIDDNFDRINSIGWETLYEWRGG